MPEPMAVAATTLVAAGGAASYAASSFLKNYEADDDSFEWYRFTATVILGAGIGAIAGMAGADVTREFVLSQLAMYAGLSVVIEKLLKAANAAYGRRFG